MIAVTCGVPDCRFHNGGLSIAQLADFHRRFVTPEFEADVASGLSHCEALALSIDRVEADERDAREVVTDVVSPFAPAPAAAVAGEVGALLPIRHRAKARRDWWAIALWATGLALAVVVIFLTTGGAL